MVDVLTRLVRIRISRMAPTAQGWPAYRRSKSRHRLLSMIIRPMAQPVCSSRAQSRRLFLLTITSRRFYKVAWPFASQTDGSQIKAAEISVCLVIGKFVIAADATPSRFRFFLRSLPHPELFVNTYETGRVLQETRCGIHTMPLLTRHVRLQT